MTGVEKVSTRKMTPFKEMWLGRHDDDGAADDVDVDDDDDDDDDDN